VARRYAVINENTKTVTRYSDFIKIAKALKCSNGDLGLGRVEVEVERLDGFSLP
jgi:hypothetical protein